MQVPATNLCTTKQPRHTGPKDANPNVCVTVGMLQGKLVSRTDANMLVEIVPDSLAPKPMFTYTSINPKFKVLVLQSPLLHHCLILGFSGSVACAV